MSLNKIDRVLKQTECLLKLGTTTHGCKILGTNNCRLSRTRAKT